MSITVGTFNLNNLFSRFNFSAEIDAAPGDGEGGITLTFDQDDISVRAFMGRLVKAKDADETQKIAHRIQDVMNADVLAVQEVEHIGILKRFNADHLDGLYPHIALIEGNDPRMIDVGVMSKFPIGAITSHQTATHPDDPNKRVFGRDLLQAEILDADGDKLFTLYNTHLKSHFVPFGEDPVEGARRANERRRRQAEMVAKIIGRMERSDAKFVLAGDMNDPPDSEFLAPMLTVDNNPLTNALEDATETRDPKPETQGPGPQTPVWTHRFNPPGPEFPRFELFDQIWVSERLSDKVGMAKIDRRTTHGGDGSDHDPAWIELDL